MASLLCPLPDRLCTTHPGEYSKRTTTRAKVHLQDQIWPTRPIVKWFWPSLSNSRSSHHINKLQPPWPERAALPQTHCSVWCLHCTEFPIPLLWVISPMWYPVIGSSKPSPDSWGSPVLEVRYLWWSLLPSASFTHEMEAPEDAQKDLIVLKFWSLTVPGILSTYIWWMYKWINITQLNLSQTQPSC